MISQKIRDYMDPLPDVEMIPLEQDGKHVLQLKALALATKDRCWAPSVSMVCCLSTAIR